MKTLSTAVAIVMILSGCTTRLQPEDDSPTLSYEVPRSYQTVFLRAQNQAQECLRGQQQYTVQTDVNAEERSGVISVVSPVLENEVARTELKAVDDQHTAVKHVVWGRAPWGEDALYAMRKSVMMDTSVCVAYD